MDELVVMDELVMMMVATVMVVVCRPVVPVEMMVMHTRHHDDRSMVVMRMPTVVMMPPVVMMMLYLNHRVLAGTGRWRRQHRRGLAPRNEGSESDRSGEQRNPEELARHDSPSNIRRNARLPSSN